MHRILFSISLVIAQSIGSCGSNNSGSTPVTSNVQPISVNAGPAQNYFNGAFTSVTICVPNQTIACQTIDGLLVDTGSSGLRILSSVVTVALSPQIANGNQVFTCGEFADGYTWGPVQTADIQMAGLRAPSVPIQVIGAPGSPAVPDSCSSVGPPENTLATIGANGILGLGLFRQDCGPACAIGGASNPGLYFVCPTAAACQPTAEPVALQLQNPVWLFPTDNNGVVIQLAAVAAAGQAAVAGTLLFGIGTRANNALGAAKVSTVDLVGNFTTTLGGRSYTSSYVDSGTNAYSFLDGPTTGLPVCADWPDFYCPTAPASFSAVTQGINGTTTPLGFTIGNADQRLSNLSLTAFVDIGGPNPGTIVWGLPFFYGRSVFTAIEGQNTPVGSGPYWAY